jgi:predicted dehydrogenase
MKRMTLAELGLPTNIELPKRKDWRIGVVGLGGISPQHLDAYEAAGFRLFAAADLDPKRTAAAQSRYGFEKVYAGFEELIADPEVEIISLLTQPTLRERALAAAVAAGKPLQTEKPMADDLATAERMVKLASDAGVAFSVNQNYRWNRASFAAQNLIEAGFIGRPYLASIEIHGTQDRDFAGHEYYSKCSDFLTVEWNTHLADLVSCWMGRKALRVSTRTSRKPGQAFRSDNLLVSTIDFGQDGTGLIIHNELHRGGVSRYHARVEGESGTLHFPIWGDEDLTLCSERLGDEPVQVACSPEGFLNSFVGPIADLMRALEDGREPALSGRRNLQTLRQVFAEKESTARNGEWVAVAQD